MPLPNYKNAGIIYLRKCFFLHASPVEFFLSLNWYQTLPPRGTISQRVQAFSKKRRGGTLSDSVELE